jgi:hypothetical protein
MNKVIIVLFLTLAVASAQDICQLYLLTSIPLLSPLYTNYKNRDWVALEKSIENLIPTTKLLTQNCLNHNILTSDGSQRCLNSVYTLSRMFAPLANELNNSEALVNLVNNFGNASKEFYTACYYNPLWGATQEELALFESSDADFLQDPQVKDIFSCIGSATQLFPLFKSFIADVKGKKGFEVISNDLKGIFAAISPLCDNCGIPKPKGKGGPVDIGACLVSAEKLADDAYLIVNSGSNFSKIIQGISAFINDLGAALGQCGVVA